MKKVIVSLIAAVASISALHAGVVGSNYIGASFLKASEDYTAYGAGFNWAAVEDQFDVSFVAAYAEYGGYWSNIKDMRSAILSGRYYSSQSFGKPFFEFGVGYAKQNTRGASVKSLAVLGSVGVELDIAEKWSFIPSLSYTFFEAASDGQFAVSGTLYYRVIESLSLGLSAAYVDTEVGGSSGVGMGVNIHF